VPTIRCKELAKALEGITKGDYWPVYLLFGQEYLTGRAVDALLEALLTEEQRPFNLVVIDGDREDVADTIHFLNSFPLITGSKVVLVKNTRAFHSKVTAKDLLSEARSSYQKGHLSEALKSLQRMCASVKLGVEETGGDFLLEINDMQWKEAFGLQRTPEDAAMIKRLVEHGLDQEMPWNVGEVSGDALDAAIDRGFAGKNVLVLSANVIDRRKRLYKLLDKVGLVVDCSVGEGDSKKAKDQKQELVIHQLREQLLETGKRLSPDAHKRFLKDAGADLRQIGSELEKLITYVGDGKTIELGDVEAVVCSSREEAVYEVMDTLANRDFVRSCLVLDKLWDQGFFPLAVLKVIGDEVRRLLWAKTRFHQGKVTYHQFQLGMNKELDDADREVIGQMAPYGIFKLIDYAGNFSDDELAFALGRVLEADIALKTGAPDPKGVLVDLLAHICLETYDKQERPF